MALALLSLGAGAGRGAAARKASGMIKKIGGRYVVVSETTGRRFGTYNTRVEAERRLRQIEFFKHMRSRSSRRRTVSPRGR